ncbi:MAG TPA: FecR domain-containing protein [Gemmatimonadaceae bacterium]|nr:FecR domain-containing protein [Gemmatimonadaceae bacterium]
MLDETMDRRIVRYITGECDAEEANQIRLWIAADPARAEQVASLERVWRATGALPSRWDTAAAWTAVRAHVEARARDAAARPALAPVPASRRTWRAWGAPRTPRSALARLAPIAAALLVVAGGGLWWGLGHRVHRAVPPAPLEQIATRRGQLADVYLSDGTHVLLGVESRLRFAAPLGRDSRDVWLEGEAVFDVAHDARVPFVVHTSRATASDLGTRFDVRAYGDDSTTTVVVAAGRVLLAPRAAPSSAARASASAVLAAGDLGQLGAEPRVRTRHGVLVERYLAWTDRRLAFTDTPLREVLPQLGRWYDLDFRLGDPSLAERRLTATLTSESVPDLLRALALTLEVRSERHGRVVTLYPASRRR